tara:strand:- start:3751 stop:5181 length:1431 start_codon:yes stop_codon:yes gene_type:complete
MSIEDRRNSVLRSSISIKSIQKTVTSFREGLTKLTSTSTDIIEQTRDTNAFKKKLVRNDNEYFEKRRENARRRQREDELESSSLSGVAKKTGNLIQRSTKGFLGRIIDFFAISLLGFFVTVLPGILKKLTFLIELIKKTVQVLKFFTDGLANFLVDMQEGIVAQFEKIRGADYESATRQLNEETDNVTDRLTALNLNLFQGGKLFVDYANEVDNEELIQLEDDKKDTTETKGDETPQQREDNKKTQQKNDNQTEDTEDTEELTSKEKLDNTNLENNDTDKLVKGLKNNIDENNLKEQGKTKANKEKEIAEEDNVEEEKKSNNFFRNLFGRKEKSSKEKRDDQEVKVASNKVNESVKTNAQKNFKEFTDDLELEPEEGYANIDGMFDPVGTSNRGKTEFGPGEFDNKIVVSRIPMDANTISQERKSDTIIVMNNNNQNTPQGGGVNTKSGKNISMIPTTKNEKNTMKKIQSKVLSGF